MSEGRRPGQNKPGVHADGRIYGMSAEDRLKANSVENANGCWIWQRASDKWGYGNTSVDGVRWWTHRLSYVTFIGPIPEGMVVDHLCFTPACVNPEHLQAITMPANSARQQKSLASHCQRGHEWTPENTLVQKNRHPFGGPTYRNCRECRRLRDQARRARERAA